MTYLDPALPLLLLLAALGTLSAWRHSTAGRRPRLVSAAVLGLAVLCWEPAAWLFAMPLESPYSRSPIPPEHGGAIVVLAGAVRPPQTDTPYAVAGRNTFERIQHAIWLHRKWTGLPVLASGGGRFPDAYAATMRELLEDGGIPAESIWIEARSRNTHENAQFSAAILREHGVDRVILVTDALSMRRAAACFAREGIGVIPAAFGFHPVGWQWEDLLPSWHAVEINSTALHEIAGLLWYRLQGWI